MNKQDWELNQYENAAAYVKCGHSVAEASREFDLPEIDIARFIERNREC